MSGILGFVGKIVCARLHSFISYVSKGCGKGLLGEPSKRAQLRAKVLNMLLREPQTQTLGIGFLLLECPLKKYV